MANEVDFEQVLILFESHGWKLQRIWEHNRVFIKHGEPFPWLIPVKNKKVDIEYVHRFEKFVKEQNED